MNFFEYITKLAPVGETVLFVRQKPQLKTALTNSTPMAR
jgi:hypothetical protein